MGVGRISVLERVSNLQRNSKNGVWEVIYSKHDRAFADKVMAEAEWTRHRRATLRHRLEPLDFIRVMLGYMPLLIWVALLSVAVGLYDITLVKNHGWPMLSAECVETFFSSITVALTLLLVFKTNSSYDRWWEARKNIGQLTSWSHNFTRQAVAYFPPHQAHLVHALARWTSSAMYAVKSLVRQGSSLKEELQGILMPEELDWLVAQRHKPLAVGQALSAIVHAADVNAMTKHRMDSMLSLYTFEFGACNRIYNTAIPSAYTRHTSRFLLCYICVGLPLLMWPMAGWASPVLAVVISFLLLGIENISAYIEEPFYVIAFDTFCAAVARDLQSIMSMYDSSAVGCPLNNSPVIGGLNSPGPDRLAAAAAAAAEAEAAEAEAAAGTLGGDDSSSEASHAVTPLHAAAAAGSEAAGRPRVVPADGQHPSRRFRSLSVQQQQQQQHVSEQQQQQQQRGRPDSADSALDCAVTIVQ